MAYQVLNTNMVHDVRHDLESAIWFLQWMVLRHTLLIDHNGVEFELSRRHWYHQVLFGATTERGSAKSKLFFWSEPLPWQVKGNQPLTDLILSLEKLVLRQNRNQEVDDEQSAAVPMIYNSVLTEINRALASSNWPANDAAMPFMLLLDDSGSGPESKGRKHPREEDNAESPADSEDAEGTASGNDLPRRPAKRILLEPSPLRIEIEPNPFG